MKCPKCGSYNKPEYKRCYVCSTLLPQSEDSAVESDHSPWSNPPKNQKIPDNINEDGNYTFNIDVDKDVVSQVKKEKKNYSIYTKREETKRRGVWGGRNKPSHGYRGEDSIPIVALDDESNVEMPKRRRRGSRHVREDLSKNAQKIKHYREGQEVGVVIPPETPKPKKKRITVTPKVKKKPNERYSIKWGRLIIACLLMAGIIFGAIIGITYLVKSISASMEEIFVPRNQLPNDGQPMVERLLKKGQTWHRITFYGEDGDKVLVQDESHNINRTLTIQDKQAVLELDDYSYIPLEDEEYYDSPFAYIDLEAWHFDKDGVETELEIPQYRISIPLAPLTIISPTEQMSEEKTTQVYVKVKVDDGSRVLLGEKNMSGNVDKDGYTGTYIDVDPGTNIIDVVVEMDGYRANHYQLTVECPERSIYMEYTDAPTEETTEEIIINGLTEPGTTLTTDAFLTIDEVNVNAKGEFYMRIRLSKFGWNEINLYATTPDGRTATMTHRINRIPYEGEYTRSAWKLDYKALTASPERLEGQIYHIPGTVEKRIDTPEARIFLFNAGTEEQPQMLMIQYNGYNDLKEDGTRYEAYADVLGKFQNLPYLHARYIYVSEDQDGDGVPDDEAVAESEAETVEE